MKHIMLAALWLIVFATPVFNLQAQTTTASYVPNITPKAPDASALMNLLISR